MDLKKIFLIPPFFNTMHYSGWQSAAMKYFSYIPFPERIYSIKDTFVLFNGLFYSSGNIVSLMNVISVWKGIPKKRIIPVSFEGENR
jgi:hypothetical protein